MKDQMGIEYTARVKFEDGFTLYKLQHNMEKVADIHSKLITFSRDDLMSSIGAFWVLLRLKIYISCDLHDVEEMDITTWHYKNIGVMWYRGFEFEVNGKSVGNAVSAWAILDGATHRVLRPNHIPNHADAINLNHGEPEILNKLKISDNLPEVEKYKVFDEDIDINGHMNNARYTRLAETILKVPQALYTFEIDYASEAKKDDIIVLRSDGKMLHGSICDKDCFSARIF